MRHPVSTRSRWAAAPGRPKQGPTRPAGRLPYSAIGVHQWRRAAAPGRPKQGPTRPAGRLRYSAIGVHQ